MADVTFVNGDTIFKDADVKWGSVTLLNITISPTSSSKLLGESVTYTITANYSDGSSVDVTALSTLISSNTALVSMIGNVGSCVGVGSCVITATYGIFYALATVAVVDYVLIWASNGVENLTMTSTKQLIIYAELSDGTTTDVTSLCSFSSRDTNLLTVVAGGLCSAWYEGQVVVEVSMSSLLGDTLTTEITFFIPGLIASKSLYPLISECKTPTFMEEKMLETQNSPLSNSSSTTTTWLLPAAVSGSKKADLDTVKTTWSK